MKDFTSAFPIFLDISAIYIVQNFLIKKRSYQVMVNTFFHHVIMEKMICFHLNSIIRRLLQKMRNTHSNRIFLILSSLFFAVAGSAQTIKDKTFINVVLIENKDVTMTGNNILIDVPFKTETTHVGIFYNDTRIPNNVFFNSPSFYPGLEEFIIIAPDAEYYRSVANYAKSNGLSGAEPITTNKIFHVKRTNEKVKVDSIRIQGNNQPKISFAKPSLTEADWITVYYVNCYGSVCCPPDPKWSLNIDEKQLITQFENRNQVKIRNTYRQTTGKEGEHCTYYTLSGLTPILKLRFLIDRQLYLAPDNKAKKEKEIAQIYTPQIISKKGNLLN